MTPFPSNSKAFRTQTKQNQVCRRRSNIRASVSGREGGTTNASPHFSFLISFHIGYVPKIQKRFGVLVPLASGNALEPVPPVEDRRWRRLVVFGMDGVAFHLLVGRRVWKPVYLAGGPLLVHVDGF